MSEKPILFNTEMVKAIIEGRKTVTRRIIKKTNNKDFIGFVTCSVPKGDEGKVAFGRGSLEDIGNANIDEYVRPPYKVGDILYVRETWKKYTKRIGKGENCRIAEFYGYKADEDKRGNPSEFYEGNWKPSIHMPKEAARIFLKVTNVRVERLQDITTEETLKEGVIQRFPNVNDKYTPDVLRGGFIGLWNSTIKDSDYNNYSYKANPWVWVIEFERIEKEIENNV
ncbi:hypothetical protein [Clostridium sp. 1001275B_160808_H3]|uniref:hypothetical protein n=1 Tax=Clostridium sp. 1001275B_160808_H3 TaxID=2787110 RepID=UPI00189A8E36|nr:hypothetical protein [Clostridium sp. 1001275B_160808_H3]